METNFYEFNQNNTGGSFVTDKELCHRLVIEASSESNAIDIAERLGCYWNGVEDGNDCPCCGDRWYPSASIIRLPEMDDRGWEVYVWDIPNAENEWKTRYGHLPILVEPKWITKYSSKCYTGKVKFTTIQHYCQFMADEYGWTTPDTRIFYLDGQIEEFYSKRAK